MAKQRIGIAEVRLRAAHRLPHFRKYVMSLVPVERPGLGTVCVDQHGRLYYDPDWLLQRPIDESSFILLHETYHLLSRLWERAETAMGPDATQRRGELWNMAADLATNGVLVESGLECPQDGMLPRKMQPRMEDGLQIEDYFQELLNREPPPPPPPPPQPKGQPSEDQSNEGDQDDDSPGDGQKAPGDDEGQDTAPDPGEEDGDGETGDNPGPGGQEGESEGQPGDGQDGGGGQDGEPSQDGPGGDGAPYDGPPPDRQKGEGGSCSDGRQKPWEEPAPEECDTPGLDNVDKKMLERQVAREVEEAAKSRGNVPGSLRRWAKGILRPKTDPVRELLAKCRFAVASVPGYGDFTYKRPPRRKPQGAAILPAHVKPIPEVLVLCDTSGSMGQRDFALAFGLVQQVMRALPNGNVRFACGDTHLAAVKRVSRLEQIELLGGGGTDVGCMIEQAAKERPRPNVVVALTDGETPWPAKPIPGLNVVACLTRESRYYPVPGWIQKVVLKPQEEESYA